MNWKKLSTMEDLQSAIEESHQTPVGLFKHSTRCSISATAKDRLERNWSKIDGKISPYYLDLIAHRDISNAIQDTFGITHESPQFILVKDGKAVYHESHFGIQVSEIAEQI
ncbi:bacillithiol system redox-active protein YtxJ [Leadbetterella byssophila]|uniref:bacillithiol system redox-active protein YtxJ n=1 Tax=Leadbetterella byssophila TaxID=316068 RepID=UPI0039A2D953